MLGKHLLKSWSSTQGPIALSSGEAEFYGVVKGSSAALGYQALLSDLGISLDVRVWTDSSATMGICGRRGLGKLRHVDTQSLWIQQKVREKEFELRKVRGDMNPADVCTKHLTSFDKISSLLKLFNCEFRDGRAAGAPKMKKGESDAAPLLSVQKECLEESIDWNGYVYPVETLDDQKVPEAYAHIHGIMPHEHDTLDEYFPKAVACDEEPEREEQLDELEVRGRELGRRVAEKQNNVK